MKKENINKIIIVLIIIGLIAAFRIFNLGDYFSLAYIKDSQERFEVHFPTNIVFVSYLDIHGSRDSPIRLR